ncbi:hypothetical protein [Streptomyces sp. MNP-20]|uniref:hypothetical protein n=1 Tax=Streptomyces sp. MNP-20 TaxID=2721165 RepID=UPI00155777BC|nr:hypothetical protein [Streptomyces sp. MNP-20]
MKRRKAWVVAGALAAVVVPSVTATGPAAAAPRATEPVAQVLPPLPGDTNAYASLMNDAGQVVGSSSDGNGHYRPVRWEPDLTPTRLGLLEGGTLADPKVIVADGSIAGQAAAADKQWHPVVWGTAGTVRRLPEPAGYATGVAEDLNDDGVSVGTVSDSWVSRAVRWNRQGQPELLPVEPNMRYSKALFVDKQGNAYGWMSSTAAPGDVVRWDRSGNITRLKSPDDPYYTYAELRDVNDRGTAVGANGTGENWVAAMALPGGTFTSLPGARHKSTVTDVNATDVALGGVNGSAVRWEGGEMVRLQPVTGTVDVQASALNDAGTVVGSSSVNAVTWDATGRPTKLPVTPDVRSARGLAINRPGHVLGYIDTWAASRIPVVWR